MQTRLLIALLALTLAGPAVADGALDAPEFIRFKAGKQMHHGALQISQVTYTSPKTKVKVVLYGVVHIADMAYYKAIQRDLDSYDAVLYEGVGKPKEGTVVKPPSEDMVALSQLQKGMGELLGLAFQKDGINYKAKNLIHADFSYEQMQEATGGDMSKAMPGMFSPQMMKQLGPMLKAGMGFMKNMMDNNPAMRMRFQHQMASQLATQAENAIQGEMKRIIVVERNKVAMGVLDRELAKRKDGTLAIFYGAAHNKDFHERLLKRGFKATHIEWKNAWTIGDGPEDGSGVLAKTNVQPKKAQPKKGGKKNVEPLELKPGKRYYE